MDVGIKIPETLPLVIAEVVDVGQVLRATIPLVIVGDMLTEVDLGHKITVTLSISISEK